MQTNSTAPDESRDDASREQGHENRRRFWMSHAVVPFIAFAILTILFEWLPIDVAFARDWAYDGATGWIGHGRWWAEKLLHTDGRIAVIAIIATLLVAFLLSFVVARLRPARSTLLYLVATMVLAWGFVGGLKQVTNVPCPWSVEGFGGHHPHVGLFDARPAGYERAACFPGAHSGSGFALVAFYFAFRDRRPKRARAALMTAAVVGVTLAFAQEARGAHFLSHDVTSAFLVWFIALGTYVVWRRVTQNRSAANLPYSEVVAGSQDLKAA